MKTKYGDGILKFEDPKIDSGRLDPLHNFEFKCEFKTYGRSGEAGLFFITQKFPFWQAILKH